LNNILIYGIGNPERQDDSLGILFLEKIEKWSAEKALKGFLFETNYQLNIEDTALMSEKELVIFVDATHDPIDEFTLNKVSPRYDTGISSHHMTPETLLKLCEEVFHKMPSVFLLAIKGYRWELNMPPTARALKNLDSALQYVIEIISNSIEIHAIENMLLHQRVKH